MIAHWGDIRDIPADIADGDNPGFQQLRANGAPWLTDSVTLVEGANITLTQSGDTIEIAAFPVGSSLWADSTTFLMVDGAKGIFGYGNYGYGDQKATHINLGEACTTGASGMNNKYATVGGGYRNIASGENATVGGGGGNIASGNYDATVGGGSLNIASGSDATVGGGLQNTASNDYSTVGGGSTNTASGYSSVITGGLGNNVSGSFSSIPGGAANIDSADYSLVFGENNLLRATASYSVLNTTVAVDSTFIVGLPYTDVQGITINDSLYFEGAWRTSWPISGLVNFTESNYIYDVKAGDKLQAIGDSANIDFVISPKGEGGILARQPDGTVTGGNNRGNHAVDLQIWRSDPSQVASGLASTIVGGNENTASGDYSTAMGEENTASGYAATSMGYHTVASGLVATSMGRYCTASGQGSFAIGFITESTASHSVAMGYHTQATANMAFAMGLSTQATGNTSTALGYSTRASGYFSTAMGQYTIAPSSSETAIGQFNTEYTPVCTELDWDESDRLFVVGNGIFTERSDAFTIPKNANTTIGGSLALNANSTDSSYTFPVDRGLNGQVLTTDGSGITSWETGGIGDGHSLDAADGDPVDAVYIDNDGNVGIGTTTPNSKLTFDNSSGDGFDEWSDYKILLYTRTTPAGSYGLGIKANTLAFNTAQDYDFDKEGVTLMTIQDGNVGIGTTSPEHKLHVTGTESGSASAGHAVGYFKNLYDGTASNPAAVYGECANTDNYGIGGYFKGGWQGVAGAVYATSDRDYYGVTGYVDGGSGTNYGVLGHAYGGTTNYGVYGYANGGTDYGVYCNGDGAYTGSWTDVSDRKFKKNIRPMEGILEKVLLLQPKTFEMRTQGYDFMGFSDGAEYGLIAQELEEVFPELVKHGVHPGDEKNHAPVEYKGIDYIPLTAILIEAMQEQQAQIEQLRAEKDAEIAELRARIEALESK